MQPAEVEHMLGEAARTLAADELWLRETGARLRQADERLDKAFGKLLGRSG